MTVQLDCLPDHVLLGLSGGADSVALLLMLLDSGKRVEAAHVHHGLRGEASDGDEAFVRALCAEKGVPLRVYHATPPAHPGEDWARRARYGFLREAMAATGAEALALAHHRDDQAETLLMHLLRGAGLNGLTGMAADATIDGLRVVRPLLTVSRKELRAFLTARGQPWREDASNGDTRYLRNALRLEILPRLEALTPGASARIAATADALREDEEALAWAARRFLIEHADGLCLPLRSLVPLPEGMRKRVLRAWWTAQEPEPLNRRQTEALSRLTEASAGGACNLPRCWRAYRGWTHLHLLPPREDAPFAPVPAADGAALGGVTLRVTAAESDYGDGRISQRVPADFFAGLTIRPWRAGDWIRPFGAAGRQSLQDYFINRHVDAPFRRRVPLLCRGAEVLLVCGVGAGNLPRMTSASPGVTLRWSGPMPWLQGKDDGP